jgi:cell division septum initiation protein DivIVA
MIKEQVSELAKNEEAFLRAFDTEYRVRRYYHLIELLEEFAGNKHSAADREALENLKLRLWAGFDRARDIEWRAWTTTHEGWFRDSLQHLQSRSPAISAAEVHNLLQQMQSRLTQEYDALHRQGKETADALEDSVRRIAQSASSHDSIAHSLIQISQAFEQFEYWDMFLYPITALADLGERDIIDWVRISPGDTTYVLKRPEDKLAGETLFHFGGFLEGKWRANDIMWGRLDTAEMLVRTILKDAPQEAQNAIIHQIQAQIASEELRPGITNSSGFSYKRYLEEEYRVGTEGIEDVSMAKRVNLAVQSASVLRNMFRTASQDADTSMAVRSIANVLSTVLTWLTRFVTPVAEALFSDDSLRRRGYLLALVGLAGWGLVTLALWILGVIEPDPRVLGLSAVAVLPLLIYSYVKNKLLGSILSIVFLLLLVGAILLWARPDSWIAKLLGTG